MYWNKDRSDKNNQSYSLKNAITIDDLKAIFLFEFFC
jgi:hypothetical protein